jgi:hypothetical protein
MNILNELDLTWIRTKERISQKGGVQTYPALAVMYSWSDRR